MRAVDGQARRDLKGLYMGLFTGKTVIVTGGGKATLKDGSAGSIGYGIDIAFAKEGANLVITGRNVAKLEAAKESLEAEYGVKVLPVQADVSAGQDNEAVVQNVIDKAIDQALAESHEQGIHGKETTPFLLARVAELTGGDSLESNIQLVLNNARVAAKTAVALCK